MLKRWGDLSGTRFQHLLILDPFMAQAGPLPLLYAGEERTAWCRTYAPGLEEFVALDDERPRCETLFRQYTNKWDGQTTVWYCARRVSEMSSLGAFLHSGPEFLGAQFIDTARQAPDVSGTGGFAPELVPELGTLARELDPALARHLSDLYELSARDTACIRIFEAGRLAERPEDWLDSAILNHIPMDWEKLERLFANIWNEFNKDGWHIADYHVLLWRLRELAQSGRIAWQGLGSGAFFDTHAAPGELRRLC